MARRDVDKYYDIISEQYADLIQELEEAEKEDIPEDIVEDIKKDISIVKANRDRWAYMMYLLNRPARAEKAKKYDKCYNQKMIEKYGDNSAQATVEENDEALQRIRESR